MYKLILLILVASIVLLSCAPGAQRIPAGPAAPTSEDQIQPIEEAPQQQATPTASPAVEKTPMPAATPSVTPVAPPPAQKTSLPATTPAAAPKGEQAMLLREQSRNNARVVVEKDSTFRFDGMKESLQLAGEKSLDENTWEFVYTFDSRYAGYGDRTGRIMAAVITPHKARIVVRGGVVTEAIIDEQWNMLTQTMLERR